MSLFKLLNPLITFHQKKLYQKYDLAFNDPRSHQEAVLKKILKRSQGTEIVKKLKIDSCLNDIEVFKKNCPTTTYEDYQDICQSMYDTNNSPNRMAKKSCDYFVTTSGTTSTPKCIPIQNDYRDEYMQTFLAWIGCLKTIRPETFSGKAIYLGDVRLTGYSKTKVACGVMSGYNYRKLPSLLRKNLYCTHESFYALTDSKFTEISLLTHSIAADLTLFGTIMPEAISIFINKVFKYPEEILAYLKTGKPPFPYDKSFEKHLIIEPNLTAYTRIEKLLKKGSIDSILEIYPNLKTIICWKSSTAKFYLDRVKKIIPKEVVIWDGIYSASEGWFNIPIDPNGVGGPVAIKSHFIEFKEIKDNIETEPFLGVHELELNKEYELFATTSMGFFRYRMYDKVKVSGFYKATPIIEFVEKTGDYLAIAMERITAHHVCELSEKFLKLNSINSSEIKYFALAPCYKSALPHYSLIVETDLASSRFNQESLTDLLGEINPNFKRNIEYKILGPVNLLIIPNGYTAKLLEKREASGISTAQFKFSPIEKSDHLTKEICSCNRQI